eukprot:maker-scaffold_85-snap-gene-0.43-mRNA-1 protein AED:0.19 eAED:0.19 QI:0/0/0.5/1/0/0/2/60/232
MRRLIGKEKKVEVKSAQEVTEGITAKVDGYDQKANKYEREFTAKVKKLQTRYGKDPRKWPIAEKSRLKQLKARKDMYIKQSNQLAAQEMNLVKQDMALENFQIVQDTFVATKNNLKALKKANKKVNIDKVEDMQDKMLEMQEEADEIMEIMGEGVMGEADDLDDMELEAELEGLDLDGELFEDTQVANYVNDDGLNNPLPAVPTGNTAQGVDEFGLPAAPVPAKPQAIKNIY